MNETLLQLDSETRDTKVSLCYEQQVLDLAEKIIAEIQQTEQANETCLEGWVF
jgi:hypothetical protein